jgi:hypothetical protein
MTDANVCIIPYEDATQQFEAVYPRFLNALLSEDEFLSVLMQASCSYSHTLNTRDFRNKCARVAFLPGTLLIIGGILLLVFTSEFDIDLGLHMIFSVLTFAIGALISLSAAIFITVNHRRCNVDAKANLLNIIYENNARYFDRGVQFVVTNAALGPDVVQFVPELHIKLYDTTQTLYQSTERTCTSNDVSTFVAEPLHPTIIYYSTQNDTR